MTPPETDQYALRKEREEALKGIAMRSHISPVELRLFGVKDQFEFRRLATSALTGLSDDREREAIKSALGGVLDPSLSRTTLGQRRDVFQNQFGVSLSTVIRLERSGGQKLAFQWKRFDTESGDESKQRTEASRRNDFADSVRTAKRNVDIRDAMHPDELRAAHQALANDQFGTLSQQVDPAVEKKIAKVYEDEIARLKAEISHLRATLRDRDNRIAKLKSVLKDL